jgi:hypothetical protein
VEGKRINAEINPTCLALEIVFAAIDQITATAPAVSLACQRHFLDPLLSRNPSVSRALLQCYRSKRKLVSVSNNNSSSSDADRGPAKRVRFENPVADVRVFESDVGPALFSSSSSSSSSSSLV